MVLLPQAMVAIDCNPKVIYFCFDLNTGFPGTHLVVVVGFA